MRYMFLIYSRELEMGDLSQAEKDAIFAGHKALMDATRQKGILQGAEPLQPTRTATTVRTENGKPLVIDGPFAETKEQLAGYYILECKDLDEAIGWASQIPTACQGRAGSVEIRPLQWQSLPPG